MSMPGSYNEEFGDDEQPAAPIRTSLAQQIQFRQPPSVVVVPPDPMIEVQRRLDMAACYQVLIAEDLFEQETIASKLVQEEIKGFIYSRLQALVNIGGAAAPQPVTATSEFSPEEVQALKAVAQSLISRQRTEPPPAPAAKSDKKTVKPPINKGKKKSEAPLPPPPPPKAAPRPKARKTQAPPGFLKTTPPLSPTAPAAAQAPSTPTTPSAPAAPPQTPGAKGRRVAKLKVRNTETGEVYDKEVVLSDARQVKPKGAQLAHQPVNQREQDQANSVAEMEAEANAQGFVTAVEKAPTLPLTRRR